MRSPFAATRNALCQAQYVPAMRSRHGSFVSSVSRASVSQRSTSCSRRMPVAWSSFSWMRVCWREPGARRLAGDTMFAWRRGRVVRQRPAKPRTAVRVRSSPPPAGTWCSSSRAARRRSEQASPPTDARRASSSFAHLSDLPVGFNLDLAESFPVPTSTILADPWRRARRELSGASGSPATRRRSRAHGLSAIECSAASIDRVRPPARSIGCG